MTADCWVMSLTPGVIVPGVIVLDSDWCWDWSKSYTVSHQWKVCDSNSVMKILFSDVKHWLLLNVFTLANIHCCQNSEASGDFCPARLPVCCWKTKGLCLVFSSAVFVWAGTFSPSLHALEAHNELVRACDWGLSAEEEAEVWGSLGWGKYTVALFHITQKFSN